VGSTRRRPWEWRGCEPCRRGCELTPCCLRFASRRPLESGIGAGGGAGGCSTEGDGGAVGVCEASPTSGGTGGGESLPIRAGSETIPAIAAAAMAATRPTLDHLICRTPTPH
jgi:hypothetical protein